MQGTASSLTEDWGCALETPLLRAAAGGKLKCGDARGGQPLDWGLGLCPSNSSPPRAAEGGEVT